MRKISWSAATKGPEIMKPGQIIRGHTADLVGALRISEIPLPPYRIRETSAPRQSGATSRSRLCAMRRAAH